MPDYEQHKIPIIEGVNDIPEPPTETEGSNISHMHEQFNNLIDSVISGHNELQENINDNYSYLNEYCYNNQQDIQNNAVTITSHRTELLGKINENKSDLSQLLFRVQNLENTLLPNTLFVFENITLSSDGSGGYKYDMTIPKTGKLINILINDTWNGQANSFKVDGGGIYTANGESDDYDNFIYAYDVGIYNQNVTENQTLTLTSTNNDTSITKIRLKIL